MFIIVPFLLFRSKILLLVNFEILKDAWSLKLRAVYQEDATSSPAITLGFSTEQDGSNKEVRRS